MLLGHATIFALFLGMVGGPTPAMASEMFGTRVRYSGASVGYQLASVFGGALAPIIATSLVQATGSAYSIPAYLVVVAVISLISILLISETRLIDIEEVDPQERALVDDAERVR